MAIENKRKIQNDLQTVLRSLEAVGDRIKVDLERTEIELSSLISLLEHSEKRDKGAEHYTFSDYKSLVEECDESVKMVKASAQVTKEYDIEDEMSIKVQLYDSQGQSIKTTPLFEDGLQRQSIANSTASELKNESTLLCHLVYSMLRSNQVSLKSPAKKTGSSVAQSGLSSVASVIPFTNVKPLVSNTSWIATPFFPSNSALMGRHFVFKFKDKVDQPLTSLIVYAEPINKNNDVIISTLANGCFKKWEFTPISKVCNLIDIV